MSRPPFIVYGHPLSGHVHRVELYLSLLGLPFERRLIDLTKGEQRAPEFLSLNPFGQVPVLDDGGTIIADSNAILVYLSRQYSDSSWLPTDALGAARVQRWLSISNGELVQGPGLARVALVFRRGDPVPHQDKAAKLLAVLETHLQASPFLVGEQRTLADLAIYSYVALAPDGGLNLQDYPAVRQWLQRVEALPGFLSPPNLQSFLARQA